MDAISRLIGFALYCAACVLMVALLASVIPRMEREYTSRYIQRQQEETARVQAQEATERVQSEQWNDTLRTWGMWGGGALAVAVVAGVGGWGAVQWQRERTRRHVASEEHTTQRALIGAQRDVVLAYIAAYGGAQARLEQAEAGYPAGTRGVLLDGEFVPWQVARRELQAARLLTADA